MPDKQTVGGMITSKGESLYSKFKMSYSILFNALSSQIIELEEIMRKSFGENENYNHLKTLKKKQERYAAELEKNKIVCPYIDLEEEPPIFKFKKDSDLLYEANWELYGVG